ncbi:hypothetical protein BACPLE_00758 [Phocaeicola plebeius DSM 17135]|uniref:Uncharacterized protein n=1 Tax=Phocaeicola plebeius (strain DSM 17135 / JCM 12973 / CCUG 54634 / M2) TaxID=484018 RepID=B5CVM5_PHOPM|nr:hypothetical protein BACPLE_00758 [Phocaeicola plebeius DSM 17135]
MKNHAKVRLLADIQKLFHQKIRIRLHLETLIGNVARILLNRKKDLMKSLYNNVYLQAYFEYKRLEKI